MLTPTAPAQTDRMPSRAEVLASTRAYAPAQRRIGLGSRIVAPDARLLEFAARYRASH
jgi:hypothetical protein